MQKNLQKFYIIGHNAADTHKKIKPWKNARVSHLEIDVQQTSYGFLAMHSFLQGFLHRIWLWPFVRPLDRMIEAVIDQEKNIYIDYKRGDIIALVGYLKNKGIVGRCTFVVYGRDRAEQLKQLLPDNDIFLHLRGQSLRIFDDKPNIYHIGVCLSPKQLTHTNVTYMKLKHAKILATFVNSFEDGMHALTLDISGITTDIPQLATLLDQKRAAKKAPQPTPQPAPYSTQSV